MLNFYKNKDFFREQSRVVSLAKDHPALRCNLFACAKKISAAIRAKSSVVLFPKKLQVIKKTAENFCGST